MKPVVIPASNLAPPFIKPPETKEQPISGLSGQITEQDSGSLINCIPSFPDGLRNVLNCLELQVKIYTSRAEMILVCLIQKILLYKKQDEIRTPTGAPTPTPTLLKVLEETNPKCLKEWNCSPTGTGSADINVETRLS